MNCMGVYQKMAVLEGIKPKEVFHFFEDLTRIPRPSYHEKAVSDYLVNFAKERHLEVHQDPLFNVIIIKEASEGYENAEPIILQGHMDMVCEKDPGVKKDMEKEGLDLVVSDGYVRAAGTTLGADDGIAIAYALALLDSKTIRHPRLEFVCTVSEEVGMDGAKAIDLSPLRGHVLLNLDSEEEGIVLAGCAGGGRANVTLPVNRCASSWERVQLHVGGLIGGHSGSEINRGRASSVSLLARALRSLSGATGLRLVSMQNGTKDNAISRDGRAVLAVQDMAAFRGKLAEIEREIRAEYRIADPDIRLTAESPEETAGVPAGADPLDAESTKAVIRLMSILPQGVQRMSDEVKDLVETSLNWGVGTLGPDAYQTSAAVRSSVNTAKDALFEQIRWTAESVGASLDITGEYPAWEWVEHSKLREKMARIYRRLFGKELVIEAIHAGVECGLLADKIPNMDAVSMGPDILDIHTPKERLSIASVQRTWEFLKRIIEEQGD